MTVKSIIDIEVNDGAFTAFKSVWDKYEQQLKTTPEAWAKVTEKVQGTRKGFDAIVAGMVATNVQAKLLIEAHKRADTITEGSANRWQAISRHTKDVAANISTATLSLMKWGTISTAVTGLLGIGSLFGLDKLAQSAQSWRQNAAGTGTTIGGYQAFTNAFQGLISDPTSFLHKVAAGQINPAKEGMALRSIGVSDADIASTDSVKTALATMDALYKFAREHKNDNLGLLAENLPVGQLASGEDLRRLSVTKPEEYAKQRAEAEQQARVADTHAEAFAKFNRVLGKAGLEIEDVFITRMASLTGPLNQLSEGFVAVVKALVGSKGFEELINQVTVSLGDFAKWINGPTFKKDIDSFTDGVTALAHKIVGALKLLGIIPDKKEDHTIIGDVVKGADRVAHPSKLWDAIKDRALTILPNSVIDTLGLSPEEKVRRGYLLNKSKQNDQQDIPLNAKPRMWSPPTAFDTEKSIKKGTFEALVEWWNSTKATSGDASTGGGLGFGGTSVGGGSGSLGSASTGGGLGFGGERGSSSGSEDAPTGHVNLPKNKRETAAIVADEWRKAGMSKSGIAGLMANIKSESNFNPTLRHPDQPKFGGEAHFAHGLYQEGGAEWNHYAAWLKKNHPGSDWKDARLQSRFAAENLKANYSKVWSRMMKDSKEEAAVDYLRGYLKPSAPNVASRSTHYRRGIPGVENYTGSQSQEKSIWDQPAGRYKADTPSKTHIQILGSVGYDPINITQTSSLTG